MALNRVSNGTAKLDFLLLQEVLERISGYLETKPLTY